MLPNVAAVGENLHSSLPLRMENTVPCSSNRGLLHARSASIGGPPSQWQSSFLQWSSPFTPLCGPAWWGGPSMLYAASVGEFSNEEFAGQGCGPRGMN